MVNKFTTLDVINLFNKHKVVYELHHVLQMNNAELDWAYWMTVAVATKQRLPDCNWANSCSPMEWRSSHKPEKGKIYTHKLCQSKRDLDRDIRYNFSAITIK